jgi:hypothetical protein
MITLKEARERGKLAKFVKEREGEEGDAGALERTVSAMAGRQVPAEPMLGGKPFRSPDGPNCSPDQKIQTTRN